MALSILPSPSLEAQGGAASTCSECRRPTRGPPNESSESNLSLEVWPSPCSQAHPHLSSQVILEVTNPLDEP